MSPSIFIQFDADVPDADQLLADLRAAGIAALSVRKSRWVGRDPVTLLEIDAGPRLDIEIMYQAWSDAAPTVGRIEDFLRAVVP